MAVLYVCVNIPSLLRYLCSQYARIVNRKNAMITETSFQAKFKFDGSNELVSYTSRPVSVFVLWTLTRGKINIKYISI